MARELSIFADESSGRGGTSRNFLLTFVLHDQSEPIAGAVERYEESLRRAGLPDIPFHSEPLLNGHGPYENLDMAQRKRLLASFGVLVQRLPVSYRTFAYRRSEVGEVAVLEARMKRDISAFLFDHLAFFQNFDEVKVYYDNGQDVVRRALDQSIGFALSREAVVRRASAMADYRLSQVADYLCTLELAALKYDAGEDGATYGKFFGGVGSFKRNWLKQARRKRLS